MASAAGAGGHGHGGHGRAGAGGRAGAEDRHCAAPPCVGIGIGVKGI